MFSKFLNHSIKNLTRNVKFDLNLGIRLLSLLSVLYIYIALFYFGLNFGSFFRTSEPPKDLIYRFNSILIYLFLVGMLLLYLFQRRMSIEMIPYLHLPLKRTKIISYMLILIPFNFFNVGFMLFFVPFSIINVLPISGIPNFIFYLTGVLLIMIFISYFVLLLRNLVYIASFFAFLPFGIIFLTLLLKSLFHVSIETISNSVFQRILHGHLFVFILVFFLMAGLLIANYLLLKNSFYIISLEKKNHLTNSSRLKKTFQISNLSWYVSLEIKLILRNKRLIGFFISTIGFLFLFYFVLLKFQNNIYFSFIIYIILSGIFGYMFSQYLFSWESSYFEFILSTNFELIKYLKAKYIIYVLLGLCVFLFFLPLVLQKRVDPYLFFTALLYNSSIGYFILFFAATFNTSRIELNRDVFLNLQGWNGTQMVAIFVIIFLPYFVLLLLTTFLPLSLSLVIINSLSIFSLCYKKKWFKIIIKQFINRKYINLEGYRK